MPDSEKVTTVVTRLGSLSRIGLAVVSIFLHSIIKTNWNQESDNVRMPYHFKFWSKGTRSLWTEHERGMGGKVQDVIFVATHFQ